MSWFSDVTDHITESVGNAVQAAGHNLTNAAIVQPLTAVGSGAGGLLGNTLTPLVQNGSLGTLAGAAASILGGGANLIPGGSGSGGGYDFVSGLLANLTGNKGGGAPAVANPGAYAAPAPASKTWIWVAAIGGGVLVLVLVVVLLMRKGRR